MLLLGHLAKVQGLKGEFLFHALMDEPDRLPRLQGLVLAPPAMNLEVADAADPPSRSVSLRLFRWHQDRPCVAFEGLADRTAAEVYKGWALWMPEAQASKAEGESFRHEWIGCAVHHGGRKVGEVVRLDPTPMGYDMVIMRDLRPGRAGERPIPYILAWWTVDLENRRLEVAPPEGLLEL